MDPGTEKCSDVAQKVYGGYRNKQDAFEMFVIEHKVNLHKKVALLIYDCVTLTLIARHTTSAMEDVAHAGHNIAKIIRLSNDTFVTLDEA
jgi:hypothetical protein